MRKLLFILPLALLMSCGGEEKKKEGGKEKGGEQTEENTNQETMTISSYELIEMVAADEDGFIKKTQEAKLFINDLVLESGYLQNGNLGATGVGYSSSNHKIIGSFSNPYNYEKINVGSDSVSVTTSEYNIELQEVKVGSLSEVKEVESIEEDGVGAITFRSKISVSGVMIRVKGKTIIVYSGKVSEHAEL